MNKKAISLFLALVMIVGLAIPGTLADESNLYDRLINTTAVISFYDYMLQASDEEKAAMTTQEITGAYNHLNKNFVIPEQETGTLNMRNWCNTQILALPNAPALCSECNTLGGHTGGCVAMPTPTPEATPEAGEPTPTPEAGETTPVPEVTPEITEPTPEPVPTAFDQIMAGTTTEEMYMTMLALMESDMAGLMAMTFEEIDAIAQKAKTLDPEQTSEDTFNLLDTLTYLPNSMTSTGCPDCGQLEEHAEECPRVQGETLVTKIEDDYTFSSDYTINNAITIKNEDTDGEANWTFSNGVLTINKTVTIPNGESLDVLVGVNDTDKIGVIKAGSSLGSDPMFIVNGILKIGQSPKQTYGKIQIQGGTIQVNSGGRLDLGLIDSVSGKATWNFAGTGKLNIYGNIPVNGSLIISGAGSSNTTLKACQSSIIAEDTKIGKRLTAYGEYLFTVNSGASIQFSNLTVDCGAVWSEDDFDSRVNRGTTNKGLQSGVAYVADQATADGGYELTATNCVFKNSHFAETKKYTFYSGHASNIYFEGDEIVNCEVNNGNGVITCLALSGGDAMQRSLTMIGTKLHSCRATGGSGGIIRTNGTTMIALTLTNIQMYDNYSSGWGNILWNAIGECKITGSTFTHNTSAKRGGAISTEGQGLIISNSAFYNNSAGEMGGAIAMFPYSLVRKGEATGSELIMNVVIGEGCIFDGNTAPLGGAIAFGIQPSKSTLPTTLAATIDIGSTGYMKNNRATNGGGAIYAGSVAITESDITNGRTLQSGSKINLTVSSGVISSNTATNKGGAIYVNDLRTEHTGINSVIVEGGIIGSAGAGNSAPNGGAVAIDDGKFIMEGGTVSGNSASQNGGAIAVTGGDVKVSGGTIGGSTETEANSAKNGGAIYVTGGEVNMTGGSIIGNKASGDGGAINVGTGNITIDSGTLSNNRAEGTGGALTVANGNVTIGRQGCDGSAESSHSHPQMIGNSAGANGGAIGIVGGTTNMYCGMLSENSCDNNPTSNSFYQNGGNFDIYGGTLDLGVDNDNGGVFKDHRTDRYWVTYIAEYDGVRRATYKMELSVGQLVLPGSAFFENDLFDRDNMVLYGWSVNNGQLNEDYKVGNTINFSGEAKLYAIWVNASYGISYNLDGGELVGEMVSAYPFKAVESVVDIPVAHKIGYAFMGWTVSGSGAGNWNNTSDCMTTLNTTGKYGNVTLTAKWGTVAHKITYDYDGGVDPNNPPGFQSDGLPITLKDPTKAGYTFIGWLDMVKDTELDPNYTIEATDDNYIRDHSYKARWQLNTYTATLNYGGGMDGSGNTDSSVVFNIKDGFILPALSRPGYSFNGWEARPAETSGHNWDVNIRYEGKVDKPYGNVTLTANWTENTVTINYVVKDNFGGEVTLGSETIGAATGEAIGSEAKAFNGYKFDGWYIGDSLVSTELAFVPEKLNGLNVAATYTAVFDYYLTGLTIGVTNSTDANQDFLFAVSGAVPGNASFSTTVAVKGNGSVTIDGLQIGQQYTITPLKVWSWRFGALNTAKTIPHTLLAPTADGVNTVTFDAGTRNPYWLSGDDNAVVN